MSFLSEIEKTRDNAFITSLVGLLLLFSPGMITVFYFQRDLFINLDFLKLLFLSLSCIVPFFIINLFLNLFFIEQTTKKEEKVEIENDKHFWFTGSMMSLILTGSIFYVSLAWSFFSKLTFESMVIKLCIIQLALTIVIILGAIADKNNKVIRNNSN